MPSSNESLQAMQPQATASSISAELRVENVAQVLLNGIDPGYDLTKSGRAKRNRYAWFRICFQSHRVPSSSKRSDEPDPNDITRHRFAAAHIKRAFTLFSYIPTLINHGIKRRAREQIGELTEGIMWVIFVLVAIQMHFPHFTKGKPWLQSFQRASGSSCGVWRRHSTISRWPNEFPSASTAGIYFPFTSYIKLKRW